jgi:DNA-binding NarL/FixJ family response regulator
MASLSRARVDGQTRTDSVQEADEPRLEPTTDVVDARLPAVLLSTSQALMRHTLTEALERLERVRVVATAGDVAETIAQAARHRPDVIVVFDDLEAGGYLLATERIIEQVDSSIVLLVRAVDENVLTRAIELGVRGYVPRANGLISLCTSLERVAGGGVAIPEDLMGPLLDQLVLHRAAEREGDELLSQLSPREREVLLLLTEGASSDGIASVLVISKETARKHIQNVLVKMGVRSRLAAVAYVMHGKRRDFLRSQAVATPVRNRA